MKVFASTILLFIALSTQAQAQLAGPYTIYWAQSQGQDCPTTCSLKGKTSWKESGLTPASWGAWGNRTVNLCSAVVGSSLFGYNLGARSGATVDSDVCNIGGGNTQHKVSAFWCQCR